MLSLMNYFCSHGKEEEKGEGKKEEEEKEEEKERTLAKVLNDIQKRLHGARAAYWGSRSHLLLLTSLSVLAGSIEGRIEFCGSQRLEICISSEFDVQAV